MSASTNRKFGRPSVVLDELAAAVGEVVVDRHRVSLGDQHVHDVAADEPRPAREEDLPGQVAEQSFHQGSPRRVLCEHRPRPMPNADGRRPRNPGPWSWSGPLRLSMPKRNTPEGVREPGQGAGPAVMPGEAPAPSPGCDAARRSGGSGAGRSRRSSRLRTRKGQGRKAVATMAIGSATAQKSALSDVADAVLAPRLAVHQRHEGEAVAAPDGPVEPLLEPRDGDVVQGHLGVNAHQGVSRLAQSHAEIVVLGDERLGVEPADLPEGVDADHHVAVRQVDLADRQVPLDVRQAVVDRPLGIPLAAAAGDERDAGMLLEVPSAPVQPAVDHLAIGVDEHARSGRRGRPARAARSPRSAPWPRSSTCVGSSLTTSTPSDRASSALPSVELPLT